MTAASDRLKKNLWFAYFCALVTWAVMAYREIAIFLMKGTLFVRVLDGRPYINDTVHWYNAALLARKCLSGNIDIYDPMVQDQNVRSITAPVAPEGLLYLQYPPQFFPLMLPFSFVPITIAYFIWCGITLALICVALWYLLKETVQAGFARWFAFAGILSCFPAWISFELAQTSLFQFPATVGFWLLMRNKRFFAAGILTAILTVKVQYLPALGLAGLILGKGKYLSGALLSTALLAVATFANVGWSNIANWPQALKFGETSTQVVGVGAHEMQNLRGELVLLLGGDTPLIHTVTMIVFAAAVSGLAFMWWRGYPALQHKIGDNSFGVCVAVSILGSLIFSPHTHFQEFFSASAALLFLYPAVRQLNGTVPSKALTVLIIGFPVFSWVFYLLKPLLAMIYIQPFFVWSLVVLVLIALMIKSPKSPVTESPSSTPA